MHHVFLPKHRTGVLAGQMGGFRIKMMRRKLVLPWPFALIPPLFTTNYSRETSGIGYSILVRKEGDAAKGKASRTASAGLA